MLCSRSTELHAFTLQSQSIQILRMYIQLNVTSFIRCLCKAEILRILNSVLQRSAIKTSGLIDAVCEILLPQRRVILDVYNEVKKLQPN